MDKHTAWRRSVAGLAALGLLVAACSTPGGSSGPGGSASPTTGSTDEPAPTAGEGGTVRIAVNQWVGAEANAAVVGHLLENELGYEVEKTTLAEEVAWQGFETNTIDVILENWGHPDLEAKYIEEQGIAQDAGPNGIQGIIGWYVPAWMVEEYPDITDWQNLNKYKDLFKTSESGDQGQFLASDPTFVTNDEALVKNLELDFKVVYSGSEAASITAFQQAQEDRTPLIGYFYDPQWLHSQVPLVKIDLPAWTEGCDADPETVACDYPLYTLNKIVATSFAEGGGPGYDLVKNFTWTNADQNLVADMITNQGMDAEEAGEQWAEDHEDVWRAWIGG